MNTREQLNQYLRGVETRLRWLVVSKGAAIAAGVALGATIALVLFTNALAFSSESLAWARFLLFVSLAVAIGFGLVLPFVRLNQRKAAKRAEVIFPDFQQRLLTFVEKREQRDPMLDLLAEDTASVAKRTQSEAVARTASIFTFATTAGAAAAVLIWLIVAGPGYMGYGSSLLWAGPPKTGTSAFYDIVVQPGNQLVRRRSDQMITAQLTGFQSPKVRLFARYKSTSKWEETAMLGRASGSVYEYLFASLAEPVEYYVEAGGVKSKTFKLDVIDLPLIKKIKVTYHYPAWLGMKDMTEDPGGDLRAVAGTIAEVSVETDRPLRSGVVELDNGNKINVEGGGTSLTVKIPIEKDGIYHFSAIEQGQSVRLSEDYFIEARLDNPPTVHIVKPRSDAKVSPIEEVNINVQADDDFGLQALELHYAVNGGAEKTVNLLDAKGTKGSAGHTMIALEEFKLVPGDVIAVYAVAKDARNTSRTDIQFIETQPFEKNYTQAQAAGGGGGGGGGEEQNQISQRQKEIIAATWNEVRGGGKNKTNSAENAKFLADVQAKLKEQTMSLSQRAKSRQLAGANQEFQSFVKDMDEAAVQMGLAAGKLKSQSWKEAQEPEQKALQHLLRAEATFRDIQVAFGNQNGGGGGGGGAGRDLANLFDLELDTEKNQYETGQQQSSAEQRQKDVDEALQKLEQLARRQQELAQAQKNNKPQTFEQRWQQEMLRREAEELKKQMEQLSRNGQQGQQGQQQSSQQSGQQSQSGQQGQQGQSGQQQSQSQQSGQSGQQQQQRPQMGRPQTAADQRLKQALDRLGQATEDMRSAQQAGQQQGQQQQGGQPGQQQNSQAEANARRAADRLNEAKEMLGGLRKQEAASQVSDLASRSEKLTAQQRDFQNRMRQQFGTQPTSQAEFNKQRQMGEQMANEKDKMTSELDQLEKDMQKAARDLAGTQSAASARVREALAGSQQDETKLRMKYAADYIRQGRGSMMVPREPTITNSLEKMTDDLKKAQSALNQGNQQQNARNQMERSLSQVEQMRNQMERLAGQQPGNQQGGQQPGQQQGGQQKGGQQAGGQQPGGQQKGGQQGGGQQPGEQQGGGQQPGGQQQPGQQAGGIQQGGRNGQPNGGNYGGRLGTNSPDYIGGGGPRFREQGIYDTATGPMDPNRAARDIGRQLSELKTQFKDSPEISKQIAELEREIQKLTIGEIAAPEMEERLRRTVLPNLQALEVQLRRQIEEQGGGQVRSGATDKVPPGYSDAVADYFRRLSKNKQ